MGFTIPLYGYSGTTGLLVAGLPAALSSFRRREVDGTWTDLTPVPVTDEGSGLYEFTVPSAYLLPGTIIKYAVDLGATAASRFLEGEIRATDTGESPAAGAELVGDTEEICLDEGDQAPPFTFVLRNQDGAAIDLSTGAPAVTFSMWPAAGGTAVIDEEPAVIVTAATATVRFDWPLEASAAAGSFLAKFSLTQNGVVSHHPVNRALVVRVLKVAP